jgi:hypothetical protein
MALIELEQGWLSRVLRIWRHKPEKPVSPTLPEEQAVVTVAVAKPKDKRRRKWPTLEEYTAQFGEIELLALPEPRQKGFCRVCGEKLPFEDYGCCVLPLINSGESRCEYVWGRMAVKGVHWLKRQVIARNSHYRCQICDVEFRDSNGCPNLHLPEIHHAKPKVEGGSDHIDNLLALCTVCHDKLHGRESNYLRKEGALLRPGGDVDSIQQKTLKSLTIRHKEAVRDSKDKRQSREFVDYSKGKAYAYQKAIDCYKGQMQSVKNIVAEETIRRGKAEKRCAEMERVVRANGMEHLLLLLNGADCAKS